MFHCIACPLVPMLCFALGCVVQCGSILPWEQSKHKNNPEFDPVVVTFLLACLCGSIGLYSALGCWYLEISHEMMAGWICVLSLLSIVAGYMLRKKVYPDKPKKKKF